MAASPIAWPCQTVMNPQLATIIPDTTEPVRVAPIDRTKNIMKAADRNILTRGTQPMRLEAAGYSRESSEDKKELIARLQGMERRTTNKDSRAAAPRRARIEMPKHGMGSCFHDHNMQSRTFNRLFPKTELGYATSL